MISCLSGCTDDALDESCGGCADCCGACFFSSSLSRGGELPSSSSDGFACLRFRFRFRDLDLAINLPTSSMGPLIFVLDLNLLLPPSLPDAALLGTLAPEEGSLCPDNPRGVANSSFDELFSSFWLLPVFMLAIS